MRLALPILFSLGLLAGDASPAARRPMTLADFHAARCYAKTSFGNIAYLDRGEGPVALFLHGFPLNSFQWRGAIDRLSAHRRCIAPDFLALGYTEVAEGQGVGPEDQVAMLMALLDKLAIRSVDLVANDSGGAVAQLLATEHPERVRTLLLTNCDGEPDSPPPAMQPLFELAKKGWWVDQWLAPGLKDKARARSKEGIGGQCFEDPGNPTDEAITAYFTPLLSSPRRKSLADAYGLALEKNSLAGIEPALKASKIPTRVLWGEADTIFSLKTPHYFERALGTSRGVRYLKGSKLFWPEEHPEIIAEEAKLLWGIR